MDSIVKVSLIILLLIITTANCVRNHTSIIKTISFELSSYLRTDCFFVYHKSNDDSQMNFETFKALSLETRRFVGWYSFEEKEIEKVCVKPMNILIGDGLKESFNRYTDRDSMTDEVWVIYLTNSPINFFNETRPPFDAEIIIAEIQSDEVKMWEIYAVGTNYPLRVTFFGNWSEEKGLVAPTLPLYDRRSDLEGKIIRIGSNENWPISTFENGKWDGYMPRIWMELESLINCTTVPVRSVDDATGLQLKDGSWNGLMGMLIKGDIDIIAAELTLTKDRTDYIEFSYPAVHARYQIFFKALGYRLQWQAIFKPLSLSIWLALFAWLIVGSICISISYYGYINCGFKEEKRLNFMRGESFFFILQTLCQQGYPVVPKSLSCRILFVTAYALSTIMIPSYSASLISSLTSETPIRPFDSLEEMVNNGHYNLLVKRNSAAYAQFSKATDSLYKEAFTKLVDKSHEQIRFEETTSLINDYICQRRHYALYGIDIVTNLKMEHERPECFILTLSKPLNPVYVSLGLRMNSPLSRIIDYKLLKLKKIGAMSRIKNSLRPLASDSSKDIGFRQVEADEIFQVFLLLLIGMVIALIILIIELIVWKLRRIKNGMIHYQNQQLIKNDKTYMICFDFFMD